MKKIVILGSLVVALGSVSALVLVEVLSDAPTPAPRVKAPPTAAKPTKKARPQRRQRRPHKEPSEFDYYNPPRDLTPKMGTARVNRLASKVGYLERPAAWPLDTLRDRLGKTTWPTAPAVIEAEVTALTLQLGQHTEAEEKRRQDRHDNITRAVWTVASRRKVDLVIDAKFVVMQPKHTDMSRPVFRQFQKKPKENNKKNGAKTGKKNRKKGSR